MRRLAILLFSLLVVAVTPSVAASAASHPDVPGREITRWDQTYTLQADGSADVVLEFDFDYGNDPGHGPYLYLVTRVQYDNDFDRAFAVSDVTASSPSGAPADLSVESDGGSTSLRIGDPDIGDVSGVQTYRVTYTIGQVANDTTADETGGTGLEGDEFYWNAVGDGWAIPISNATVTVTAPAGFTAVQCYAGRYGTGDACTSATSAGSTATFTQDYLETGEPFSVAVLMPAGTVNTEPELVRRATVKNLFLITPLTVGATALVALVGGLLLWRGLRTGVDKQYVAPTPGMIDAATSTEERDYHAVAPLLREPPGHLRPGLIGTLVDEKADARDVTATLVDLAVRGYLRVEDVVDEDDPDPLAEGPDDYRLVKIKEPDGDLLAYERTLLEGLFADRDEVTLDEIKTTFSSVMRDVQNQLYDAVVEWGWFRSHPGHARLRWGLIGGGVLVASVLLTAVCAVAWGWGLVPLPLFPLGLAMLFTIPNAPARTAEGTRVLVEAQGFEEYVSWPKVELVTEPGEDGRTFSQFLPYAVAFGATSVWAGKWAALAAGGAALAEPTWIATYGATSVWSHDFDLGSRLDDFSSTASNVMSAPPPSSSGSSGGSSFGGGGFSGGGGGGGGGGGW